MRAGHCVLFDREGTHVRQYWTPESRDHPDGLAATALRVRELLNDSVRRQLISDVPVSALLSGGLDSSGLTAIAAKELRNSGGPPPNTFSIEFAGDGQHFRADAMHRDADAPWAWTVAESLGTRHRAVRVDTPDLMDNIEVPLRGRDLPGRGESETSLFLLFRELKKEATVALSGESADEILGGYPWFYSESLLGSETFPWSPLEERSRVLSPELVQGARLEGYARDRYAEAISEVPRLAGEDARVARIREMSYLSLTRFLPYMLDRKDRMSMAVGVEARVPFCDHRLVEYAWNIPWEMKNAGDREKGVLRMAWSDLLPEGVLHRRKSSYPFIQNPSYLHAVKSEVLRVLDDPGSPVLPFVDKDAVHELAKEGDAYRRYPLGITGLVRIFDYLLQVDLWMREYRVRIL